MMEGWGTLLRYIIVTGFAIYLLCRLGISGASLGGVLGFWFAGMFTSGKQERHKW